MARKPPVTRPYQADPWHMKSVPRAAAALDKWLPDRLQQAMDMLDAVNECVHGRLPHDSFRDPDCDCWGANRGTAA